MVSYFFGYLLCLRSNIAKLVIFLLLTRLLLLFIAFLSYVTSANPNVHYLDLDFGYFKQLVETFSYGEDLGRDFISELPVEPNILVEPPMLAIASYPLGKGFAPCPSDLLLQREAINRVGEFKEEFRGMYEDQAFLVKVYL